MNRIIPWLCIAFAIIACCVAPIIVNLVKMEISEKASAKGQSALHAQVFKDVIRPAAQWVKTFRATRGMLPSETELVAYSSNYLNGTYIVIFTTPDTQAERWNPGVDFELCVFAPDWNLFYRSWDDKETKHWRH